MSETLTNFGRFRNRKATGMELTADCNILLNLDDSMQYSRHEAIDCDSDQDEDEESGLVLNSASQTTEKYFEQNRSLESFQKEPETTHRSQQ